MISFLNIFDLSRQEEKDLRRIWAERDERVKRMENLQINVVANKEKKPTLSQLSTILYELDKRTVDHDLSEGLLDELEDKLDRLSASEIIAMLKKDSPDLDRAVINQLKHLGINL